jgi:hypothetical protein
MAQEPRPLAGLILDIRAPAFIKVTENDVETSLDSARDKGRRLFGGQSLRCGHGGYIRAEIYGAIQEITESGHSIAIPLDSNPGEDVRQKERQRRISEALRSYGRMGGTRGIASSILLPSEGSVVKANQFEIRWIPSENGSTIAISIRTKSGQVLWQAAKVSGATGSLDSSDVREKLEQYRKSGAQEALILSLRDPEKNESSIEFSLISPHAEEKLRQELAQWDEESNDLVRYIGRAAVFNRHRMLVEATMEYDAALTLAPESRDLLESAISAHHQIGDYVVERELIRRLPPENK